MLDELREDELLGNILKEMAEVKYLAFAIGTNEYLHNDIHDIYAKDEYKYFESYRSSKFYKDNFFEKLPVELQDRTIKACSILCGDMRDYVDNDIKPYNLIKLITKGYRPVIQYLSTCGEVDIDEFIDFYRKKRGYKNIFFNCNIVAAVTVLCFLFSYGEELFPGMKIADRAVADSDLSTVTSIYTYLMNTTIVTSINNSSKKNEISEDIKYLIPSNKKITISEYLNRVAEIEGGNICGSRFNVNISSAINTRKIVMREGKAGKYIGLYTTLLRTINIEPNILLELYTISPNTIHSVLNFYEEITCEMTDEEVCRNLISYLFINALGEELRKTKELYFNNSKARDMDKYRKHKQEIERLEKKLKDENDKLRYENTRLKLDNKRLKESCDHNEKEIKRLSQKIENDNLNNKELNKLREFIFNMDKKEEFSDDVEIDYGLLNSVKLVIIGGHPNWQNKMKEVLPEYTFISVEQMNFDIKLLSGADGVVIYPNFLNHGMYYKVINYVRDNNINLDYLNGGVNIKLCLYQLEDLVLKLV